MIDKIKFYPVTHQLTFAIAVRSDERNKSDRVDVAKIKNFAERVETFVEVNHRVRITMDLFRKNDGGAECFSRIEFTSQTWDVVDGFNILNVDQIRNCGDR